jgi:hypothetical protein
MVDALDRPRKQDAAGPDFGANLTIVELAQRTAVPAHTSR